MRTELLIPDSRFTRERSRVLRWMLLSLGLHALLLAWAYRPAQPLTSPKVMINAALRLIAPPVSTPMTTALPREDRAPKAAALSRRLELPANKPGSVRRAQPAPQEARQPRSPAEPRPDVAASGIARPTLDEAGETVAALSQSSPAATSVPDQQQLLTHYAQQLSRLLASHLAYPRLAAMRGWEGEVRLRLKVARKGNLLSLQVDRSSGHDVLDQHALQLVDQVHMPPFPAELEGNEIQITVPVNYTLRKAV